VSWYVRYVLLNSQEIREKTVNPFNADFTDTVIDDEVEYDEELTETNLCPALDDDDLFVELLSVEKALKKLLDNGKLTASDLYLVEQASLNPYFSSLEDVLGMRRAVIADRFVTICNDVAKELGGYFTDEGYIKQMKDKSGLTDAQTEVLRMYMANSVKF
jgi:hypothetical protein